MALYEKIHARMRPRGVEYEIDGKEPWFVCEAHTQADIDHTLTALAESVREVKRES
jgi:glutamate-1-semialdehyde aminotransferase